MEQLSIEPFKLGLRSLLKSIKCLMKQADMFWKFGINITLRLHHINFSLQNAMQKCTTHIKLSQFPMIVHCQGQKQSYNSRFYNWTKGFFIAKAKLLKITPSY